MATQEALIKVDTTELDRAAAKVEYLLSLVEKLYKLSERSWLIRFLLGINNDR